MQQIPKRFAGSVAVAALLATCLGFPAAAQQAPAAAERGPRTRPAVEVLEQIGQSAGVVVLADSTVQGRLPAPTEPATPQTIEQHLAALVRLLPAGATWTKLYAPTPANGRWVGDLVANYARAQALLVGSTGRSAPAGTVELFGRYVSPEQASQHAAALNLKLVYLVTSPRAQASSEAPSNWARMSSDQRRAYADQQAQRILALNPTARMQVLRQMMGQEVRIPTPEQMIMRMVTSQMSDDERVALKQSVAVDVEGRGGK